MDCRPVKALTLVDGGWKFTEPNPYNPGGNLQDGDLPTVVLDLSDKKLPGYRLAPEHGIVMAPAITDLKLHDITPGEDDPNRETRNINAEIGS